eukprot:c11933_g1_i2.p1 GENE.c11933_g1_i2~~c11933_g1_i2.p1  ORF type:complete len:437 (-),score=101.45 c11933_g1_i2:208-1437(-)
MTNNLPVECHPQIVWGINSFTSTNCSFFQECRPNRFNTTSEFVCDCAFSDMFLGANNFGDCVKTSQSIILASCFIFVAVCGIVVFFLFDSLRASAKRKKLFLIHDLVRLTMASTFFLIGRCLILAIRITALSITYNVLIGYIYIFMIAGMLLTLALSVIIYVLLVLNVSSAGKTMFVMTDAMRIRMRTSVLRNGMIYGFASCITAGIPYMLGLSAVSHAITSSFAIIILILYSVVVLRLQTMLEPLAKRGWHHNRAFGVQKSLIVVMSSIAVFFLSTVAYVVSFTIGHTAKSNRDKSVANMRYGIGIAILLEHVSANAFQLAIIYAMRALVDKPALVERQNPNPGTHRGSRDPTITNTSNPMLVETPSLPPPSPPQLQFQTSPSSRKTTGTTGIVLWGQKSPNPTVTPV